MVDVAQSVRASDCGSEGRGFEPHLPPLRAVEKDCNKEQKPYVSAICKAFPFFIPLKEKATEDRFYGLISDLFQVRAK